MPIAPMIGVGFIDELYPSLYKLAFPLIIGISNISHAELNPLNVSISSKAPFGLVGSPKFNPSVRDIAFPPKTEIFLHASAILISAPILGSKYENLEFPSQLKIRNLSVPFTRITAASSPGSTTVLV